jgi:hypothetical protein
MFFHSTFFQKYLKFDFFNTLGVSKVLRTFFAFFLQILESTGIFLLPH